MMQLEDKLADSNEDIPVYLLASITQLCTLVYSPQGTLTKYTASAWSIFNNHFSDEVCKCSFADTL